MSVKEKLGGIKASLVNNPALTVKEQLGYCGGIFGNCMGQDCVGTYSDQFCRDCMGIEPKQLLLLENISKIIPFFASPAAGALYDRNRKNGKMSYVRMALGGMPIPFAIASLLLFIVPYSDNAKNFIFALIFFLIFNISDTFFDTAMSTLALRMVPNPKDRKSFFTLTGLASNLGSALPGFVLPLFIDTKKDAKTIQWTYFYVALAFCIIGIAVMYTVFICVKDKPVVSLAVKQNEKEKISWNRHTIGAILHNRPFIILQLATLSDSIRQVTYKELTYLYKDTLDIYKKKPIFDAVSGTLAYTGLMGVPFLSDNIAPKNIVAGGYAYTAVMYLIMSMFNIGFTVDKIRKKGLLIGLLIGLAGMPNYAMSTARNVVVADSTDYMEWYSAKKYGTPIRSDGTLSAVQSIFKKGSELLTINIYNILMDKIGYKSANAKNGEKAVQSNETLHGIFMIVSLCGLIGNTISSLLFFFDNYKGDRKKKIYAELTEMRNNRGDAAENTDRADATV